MKEISENRRASDFFQRKAQKTGCVLCAYFPLFRRPEKQALPWSAQAPRIFRGLRKAIRSAAFAATLVHVGGVWALCSTNGEFGAADAIVDAFVYRPLGVIATALGGATLVAATPFLGIASIAPPHDAIQQASEMLVLQPAAWTFDRPLGDCRAMGYDGW